MGQRAGLVNLCLVIHNFDTAEDITSLCLKCSILYCEMANGYRHGIFCFWSLTRRVTKADGYSQAIQWGAFCMAVLPQIAVLFSPMNQPAFTWRGKGLVNWVYNCCSAILDTAARSDDSSHPQHPFNKCEINNAVDGMPQWISGELFVGSGNMNTWRKRGYQFFWGRERKGCLRCSANWIDYYKMLSMQVNFRGQRTTWWHCPGCHYSLLSWTIR